MGQNFSWLEQVGHGFEQQQGERQQRAGDLRNAVLQFFRRKKIEHSSSTLETER